MAQVVFVVDGNDLSAHSSIEEAAGSIEAYDIEGLSAFLDDGTRLALSPNGYACRLTPTQGRDPDELRKRLERFLSAIGQDPTLAARPVEAAQAILDATWARRRFQWLPWLDRRFNGPPPTRVV